MARRTHFVGALAVAAGILAAVGMLVLMTLVVKVKPARAQPAGLEFAYVIAHVSSNADSFTGASKDIDLNWRYRCPGGSFYCTESTSLGIPSLPNSVPDANPAWSSDGSRIAFASAYNPDGGNDLEIYTIDNIIPNLFVPGTVSAPGTGGINGSWQPQLRRLTDNAANEGNPTWSPDGTRIAFTSNRDDPRSEIYRMRSDGTGFPTRLTNDPANDSSPDWSPAGTKIAFERQGELYTINADGTGLQQLTRRPSPQCPCRSDVTPSWNPAGTKIAFSSDRSGISENNFEIYTMNADGSGLRQHTNSPDIDISPTWSPDGTKIAFASTRGSTPGGVSQWKIYYVLSNGTVATNMRLQFDSARNPDWGPRSP